MATTVEVKGSGSSGAADLSPLDRQAHALGLPSATALVIGSIIGTGVFTMPAVMAGAGTSSILTLVTVSVGAVLLGVLFGQLTKRVPSAEGGVYAYARHEFGDFAGYLTAWCYWITAWAGNAAIVASWVLYVELPAGQVSFHSPTRGTGPDYTRDWDQQHASEERIIAFACAVAAMPEYQADDAPITAPMVTASAPPEAPLRFGDPNAIAIARRGRRRA